MPVGGNQHTFAEANGIEHRGVFRIELVNELLEPGESGLLFGRRHAAAHANDVVANRPGGRDRAAGEQHEHLVRADFQKLCEAIRAGNEAVLGVPSCGDVEFDAVIVDGQRLRRQDRRKTVQRPQVLEVDAIGHRDPRIKIARAAPIRLDDEVPFGRLGDLRRAVRGRHAVEGPDEPPCLRAWKGPNRGARWNLVAGRNVDADARRVKAPMMIGAA
jgi:hypothetical protein